MKQPATLDRKETTQPLLECKSIAKSFGPVTVLSNINLKIAVGETLGLVGENGAGKSTLMNLLSGNLQPNNGEMHFAGKPYTPQDPVKAGEAGIAIIHQELNLFANLSIAENLFIDQLPTLTRIPLIRLKKLKEAAVAALLSVGLDKKPETQVSDLSPGEQQLLEIAKALNSNAQLIIFDEPTTSLTKLEVDKLAEIIAQLKKDGVSIIYISHNLDEIFRFSDSIAVLRDGELVAHDRTVSFDQPTLISHMVGRSVDQLFPTRSSQPTHEIALQVKNLSQQGVCKDISFTLHRGEILGLSGLMGAGRSELARILFGLDEFTSGQIELNGKPYIPAPRKSIRSKLAFLTESRREDGVSLEATIGESVALVTLPNFASRTLGWLRFSEMLSKISAACKRVSLDKSARIDQDVGELSGGNQQKVILAKWLLTEPKILILDEPTRGIDIGAKAEIYQIIADLAERGTSILLISSELEELVGLADRILVMKQGLVVSEFSRKEFNREKIMAAAFGISSSDQQAG